MNYVVSHCYVCFSLGLDNINLHLVCVFDATTCESRVTYSDVVTSFSLGLDYVDLYLIHAPYGGRILETYDVLLDLKQQGLIRSGHVTTGWERTRMPVQKRI